MTKYDENPNNRGCESPAAESQTSSTDYYDQTIDSDIYKLENDLGSLYAEIMQVCQPFYSLPGASQRQSITIFPRLEDGLRQESEASYGGQQTENPQDPMAACYQQCISHTFSHETNSHAYRQLDDR